MENGEIELFKFISKLLNKDTEAGSLGNSLNASDEEKFVVLVNEEGVTLKHPKRKTESIRWDHVVEIFVITTDKGPWECDVWLCLSGENTGCLIPAEAENYDKVFDRLSSFEGFDYQSYINAMSSATNNRFVCWRRPG